jgi:hypothetical protein
MIVSPQVEPTCKKEKPEEKHAGRPTNLVVGRYVAKFLWNVANAFDDGVETLAGVDDDRVA